MSIQCETERAMALWTEWISANETGGNNFTETAE
jgi:hypothetical protein